MHSKNILLFGSTGMLGRYVLNRLKTTDYFIVCINRDIYDIVNDGDIKLNDILVKNNMCENDIIINCAGIIPQKYKKNDLKTYIKVNTLFPHKLSELSQKYHLKFIHITTDCVFDGLKGNYTEDDKHTACDIYGVSKSQGEPMDATIIRTSIIGEELVGKKSFIEWVKSNANGRIIGYSNHLWNGVTCLELANYIKHIINANDFWVGIKHIFSPNSVSKYELCCYINEIYKLNITVEKCEDSKSKNMTLVGDISITKEIYSQVNELEDYWVLI